MSIKEIKWPKHPKILEINTWTWLHALSQKYQEKVTLKNIPEKEINSDFTNFDAIWAMGVWERSPRGREIALNHPDLQVEYRNALNDFKQEDVVGSPYAIHNYKVDSNLIGPEGLATFRKQLIDRGKLLLLDYVPNHVAVDHPWTKNNPEILFQGSKEDLKKLPHDYFLVGDNVYAHGRDPNFSPWSDTAQINAFSPETRQKAIETLLVIAEQCDGVRCDMAMLLVNEVFIRTWNKKVGPPLEKEFWIEVIPAVKKEFPNFKFLAEVYWDMEWKLQQQGFDYCYDKKLYERMAHENVQAIRAHLQAEWDYQQKLVRFIENHDEKRAITVFGEDKSRAAAVIAFTLPGARLIHEGQMRGRKIKLPVQLRRGQVEQDNTELMKFYEHLLNAAPGKIFNDGNWSMCGVESIGGDFSYLNIISYIWSYKDQYKLVVVNYSSYMAKAHIKIAQLNYESEIWSFNDVLNNKNYKHDGLNLMKYGLYIELTAWNAHIFDIQKVG